MNVVLIGFRCAGKSTVGKALAARLGREFADCDEYIESKTHLSIREIFDLAGESYFRTLEGQAIQEMARSDGRVIATGGGAVLRRQNTKYLKRNGIIVLLEVTPDVAFERIRRDPSSRTRRPAMTGQEPLNEIHAQLEFRRPYYSAAADITVRTDERPVAEIVEDILKHLKARGITPPGNDQDREGVPKA